MPAPVPGYGAQQLVSAPPQRIPLCEEIPQDTRGDVGVVQVSQMILQLFDLVDDRFYILSEHFPEIFQRVTQLLNSMRNAWNCSSVAWGRMASKARTPARRA